MTENELIERLAEAMHSIWASWMQWMFEHGGRKRSGVWVMFPDKLMRWQGQANTPYGDLSEQEKESDRRVARQHLPCLIAAIEQSRKQHAELLEAAKGMVTFAVPSALVDDDRRPGYRCALEILNSAIAKADDLP